jgi:hypothetical protein
MDNLKALVKTLPTTFDLQIKQADKTKNSISFVIRRGNSIEYASISTLPEQKFKYFFNPSHLTAEERRRYLEGKTIQKVEIDPDDEP